VKTSPVLTWGFTAAGYFLRARFVPIFRPCLLPACSLLARRSDVGAGSARPVLADWSRPVSAGPIRRRLPSVIAIGGGSGSGTIQGPPEVHVRYLCPLTCEYRPVREPGRQLGRREVRTSAATRGPRAGVGSVIPAVPVRPATRPRAARDGRTASARCVCPDRAQDGSPGRYRSGPGLRVQRPDCSCRSARRTAARYPVGSWRRGYGPSRS
jgi:hypothetical protein